MRNTMLTLSILPGTFAVCRLPAHQPLPAWATQGALFSVTRAADELSIVCEDQLVPPGMLCERPWRALKVDGPLPFELTGILLSVAAPLNDASVSIFAVSTYDTDYVLVRAAQLEEAKAALANYGHHVQD